ncbi:MAG TPA: hypothetical protein VLZ03_11870 [Thermodesulfobacteriota bacterium]|nr:hypothetical protein [Thermodesulfobacteriota bacterium]
MDNDQLVYIETEGSCANCGLKDTRALTIHHLDATQPKSELYDNKIVLCHNCHQCHHQGKGPSAEEFIDIKARLIVKTLTRPGLNALKIASRKKGVSANPFMVNHLVEMRYLKCKEVVSTFMDDNDSTIEIVSEAIYEISAEGQALLARWKLK